MTQDNFIELVKSVFTQDGVLSKMYDNFHARQAQIDMAIEYAKSLYDGNTRVIEAPTGTGKSFGYLIPAALYSVLNNKPFLIATHTINLQNQLIKKDLPFVQKVIIEMSKTIPELLKPFSYTIKFARPNYRCTAAIQDNYEKHHIDEATYKALMDLDSVLDCSTYDLESAFKSYANQEKCNQKTCPHAPECPYVVSLRQFKNSNIVVTNHAYLANLLVFSKKFRTSKFHSIILDECHNFPEIMNNTSHVKIDTKIIHNVCKTYSSAIDDIMNELETEQNHKLIGLLTDHISRTSVEFDDISNRIQKNSFISSLVLAFATKDRTQFDINQFKKDIYRLNNESSELIHALLELSMLYKETMKLSIEEVIEEHIGSSEIRLKRIISLLIFICHDNNVSDASYNEYVDENLADDNQITWLELTDNNNKKELSIISQQILINAELTSPFIVNSLFTSATCFTDNNSEFFKRRMNMIETSVVEESIDVCRTFNSKVGIDGQSKDHYKLPYIVDKLQHIQDLALETPFNYKTNVRSFVIQKKPHVQLGSDWHYQYAYTVAKESNGGVLVLCTSNEQLAKYYEYFTKRQGQNNDRNFVVLSQTKNSKMEIIEQMNNNDNIVVLGVQSFWEGFDIQGRNLRIVIIDKLPFENHTDIYIKNRNERYELSGGNAFRDWSLPRVMQKIKQGIGRLLRNEKDRGLVMFFDNYDAKGFSTYGKPYAKGLLNKIKHMNITTFLIDENMETPLSSCEDLLQ